MLRIYQSEHRTLSITVTDAEGEAFDLTGFDVDFRAVAGETVIEKSDADGITVTDAAAGELEVELLAEDLATVGRYTAELRLSSDDTTVTVLQVPMVVQLSNFGGE